MAVDDHLLVVRDDQQVDQGFVHQVREDGPPEAKLVTFVAFVTVY